MNRNESGQVVSVEMVSASDGSAFTGTVTVRVTIDDGTQTLGSVGSGICTHKGNGTHSYLPAQAETDGVHIVFTFTGSGAIPVALQIYTFNPVAHAALVEAAAAAALVDYLPATSAEADAILDRLVALTPLVTGAVVADGGNSATAFKTDMDETADDYWEDAWLLITSGVLLNQVKKIGAYNGTTKVITLLKPLTGTPATGVTFNIINR